MPLVTVHLGALLRKNLGRADHTRLEVCLEEGSTIADLVKVLDLELDPEKLLLAVNGGVARPDLVLNEGDKVHLLMPISGG